MKVTCVTDNINVVFEAPYSHKSAAMLAWLESEFDKYAKEIYETLPAEPDSPALLSWSLPGVDKIVKHPVTAKKATLHSIIMNLNDSPQKDKNRAWTREEIADWIETVLPLEDILFKPPEPKDEKALFEATCLFKAERVLPL